MDNRMFRKENEKLLQGIEDRSRWVNMKDRKFWIEVIVIILVIISLALLPAIIGNIGSNTGVRYVRRYLMVTDIPAEFNGRFAFFGGQPLRGAPLIGAENINSNMGVITLPQISGGTAALSIWSHRRTARFSGAVEGFFLIIGEQTLNFDPNLENIGGLFNDVAVLEAASWHNVEFINGNASVSWDEKLTR